MNLNDYPYPTYVPVGEAIARWSRRAWLWVMALVVSRLEARVIDLEWRIASQRTRREQQ